MLKQKEKNNQNQKSKPKKIKIKRNRRVLLTLFCAKNTPVHLLLYCNSPKSHQFKQNIVRALSKRRGRPASRRNQTCWLDKQRASRTLPTTEHANTCLLVGARNACALFDNTFATFKTPKRQHAPLDDASSTHNHSIDKLLAQLASNAASQVGCSVRFGDVARWHAVRRQSHFVARSHHNKRHCFGLSQRWARSRTPRPNAKAGELDG